MIQQPISMPAFDVINIIASVASLALSVIAIWLALWHKRESDAVNKDTRTVLVDVSSDAKFVANFAKDELKGYGDMTRDVFRASFSGSVPAIRATNAVESPIVPPIQTDRTSDEV